MVDGLTVDSEDDYIYWTDFSYKRIERSSLDGKDRTEILSGLDKPRAIVLYKKARFVLPIIEFRRNLPRMMKVFTF